MTTTLNSTFANTQLPLDASYLDLITALPGFVGWWQAASDLMTLISGAPSQIADLAGGAAYFQQGTAGQRAGILAGAFGACEGLVFDGVDDEYLLSGQVLDTNAPFTWATVFAADPVPGASAQLLSNYVATNDGTWCGTSTDGTLRVRHGSGQLIFPYTAMTPSVLVFGVSGGQLRGRLNGGPVQTVPTDNNGSTATLRLGRLNSGGSQPYRGRFVDFIAFASDLFTGPEQVGLITEMAAADYGIALA